MGLKEVNVLCSCFLLFVSAALKVRCDVYGGSDRVSAVIDEVVRWVLHRWLSCLHRDRESVGRYRRPNCPAWQCCSRHES